MNGQTTIYALADPRTGEIRYIGKTSQRLERRQTGHAVDVRRRRDHRTNWIRSLNASPTIRALMVVPDDLASAAEIYAIAIYRSLGYRLTNVTNGGEGAVGAVRSDEFKANLSAFRKGKVNSPETRSKLRQINLGRKMSAEAKAKNSASKKGNKFWVGKHHTEETKEKIRQFILSKPTCSKGHEYTTENTRFNDKGWRICRTCARDLERLRRERLTGGPRPPRVNTHCSSGHEYTSANLRIDRRGFRICRACRGAYQREYKRRHQQRMQAERLR